MMYVGRGDVDASLSAPQGGRDLSLSDDYLLSSYPHSRRALYVFKTEQDHLYRDNAERDKLSDGCGCS